MAEGDPATTTGGGGGQVLEALSVRVSVDAKGFDEGFDHIESRVNALRETLASFGGGVVASLNQTFASAAKGPVAAVNQVQQSVKDATAGIQEALASSQTITPPRTATPPAGMHPLAGQVLAIVNAMTADMNDGMILIADVREEVANRLGAAAASPAVFDRVMKDLRHADQLRLIAAGDLSKVPAVAKAGGIPGANELFTWVESMKPPSGSAPPPSIHDLIAEAVRSAPVSAIPDLRAKMPAHLQGEAFNKAILKMADEGLLQLFKDVDPANLSAEHLGKMVHEHGNVFTSVAATPKLAAQSAVPPQKFTSAGRPMERDPFSLSAEEWEDALLIEEGMTSPNRAAELRKERLAREAARKKAAGTPPQPILPPSPPMPPVSALAPSLPVAEPVIPTSPTPTPVVATLTLDHKAFDVQFAALPRSFDITASLLLTGQQGVQTQLDTFKSQEVVVPIKGNYLPLVEEFEKAEAQIDAFKTQQVTIPIQGTGASFTATVSAPTDAVTQLESAVFDLGERIGVVNQTPINVATNFQSVTDAIVEIGKLVKLAADFSRDWLDAISKVKTAKDDLITNFKTLFQTITTGSGGASTSLSGMTQGLQFTPPDLKPLESWLAQLGKLPVTVPPDLTKVWLWLDQVNHQAPNIGGLASILPVLPDLTPMGAWLDAINAFPAIDKAKLDQFTRVSMALRNAAVFIKAAQYDLSKVEAAFDPLRNFVGRMAAFSSRLASSKFGTDSLKDVTLGLQRISLFVGAINRMQFGVFTGNIATFQNYTHSLIDSFAGVDDAKIAKMDGVTRTLSRIGSFLKAVPKVSAADFATVGTGIESFAGTLNKIDFDKPAVALSQGLGRIGSFIRAAPKVTSADYFDKTADSLTSFTKKLAGLDEGVIAKVGLLGKVIRDVAALSGLAKLQGMNLAQAGQAIVQFMNALSSVRVTPNLMAVGTVLARVGQAARGVAAAMRQAAASGTAVPPITPVVTNTANTINRIPASLRGVTPASRAAGSALAGLGGGMRDLTPTMNSLVGNFGMLRASILGAASFGVGQFARFDDALTRTLGHLAMMGEETRKLDWNRPEFHQANRTVLTRAVMDVSGASPTSATDLAHGLDLLAGSGMNAALAARALSTAESFALTSGMGMEAATRHLIDVQRNMGLASRDAGTHLENMTRIGDQFVAVAPQVGSTVQQLSEAMGGRFVAAAKLHGMSMEQSIGLLGAYSLAGVRGSEAADRAARAVFALGTKNVDQLMRWRRLGVEVFDAAGHMRPMADVIGDLEARLSHMSPIQRVATLSLMGFEQRTISAVLPLVGFSGAMRELESAAADSGGTMAKFADLLRRDVQSQVRILWNNATNLAIAVGNALAPAVATLAQGVGFLARAFTSLNPAVQSLIVGGAALVLGFRPLVSVLGSLAGFGLSALLAPFRLLGAIAGGVAGTLTRLAAVVAAPFRMLWSAASFAASAVYSVGAAAVKFVLGTIDFVKNLGPTLVRWGGYVADAARSVWSALTFPARVFSSIGSGIATVFGYVRSGLSAVWSFLKAGFSSLQGFTSMIGSIGSSLASSLLIGLNGIGAVVVNLLLWIPMVIGGILLLSTVLAVLGGTLATIGIGIAQLFGAIVSGIGAAWEGIKAAVASLWGGVKENAGKIRGAVVGAWDGAKAGAADFFGMAGRGIRDLAGFFWNFGKNANVVFTFVSANWREVITDIGNALVAVVENTVANIMVLGTALVQIADFAWRAVSTAARLYLGGLFDWLSSQWQAISHDAGLVFKTVFRNLADNIVSLILPLGDLIAAGLMDSSLGPILKNMFGITVKTMPFAKQGIEGAIAGLKGPLEGLDFGAQSKADYAGLSVLFGAMNREMGVQMLHLFTEVFGQNGMLSRTLGGLKPLLEGFKGVTPWEKMFEKIDLDLPEDFQGRLKEMFNKFFGPAFAEGDEAGMIGGKQGPGLQFKQISLERTMVSGPVAESLDYQQLLTLRMMNGNLEAIRIAVQRGGTPMNPPGSVVPQPAQPKPVVGQ